MYSQFCIDYSLEIWRPNALLFDVNSISVFFFSFFFFYGISIDSLERNALGSSPYNNLPFLV